MNPEEFLKAMQTEARRVRGQYHVTLGTLIDVMETYKDDTLYITTDTERLYVVGCYMGDETFSDLTLMTSKEKNAPDNTLRFLKDQIGRERLNSNGGSYKMDLNTPLWVEAGGDYNGEKIAVIGLEVLDNGILIKGLQLL